LSETDRKSAVTVRIAGEEHTIRANAEPDYTRSCARYVDERIAEIRSKGALIETHKAAILAALSISDELLQAREELDRIRKEVASRATNLARRLEGEVGGPAGG
jgi:cell division protein ZapA